jgi:D-lactate dehydrogenase
MKTAVFSARPYDRRFLEEANARDHSGQGFEFAYFDVALDASTVGLAQGFDAVCVFVNDRLDAPVLNALQALGVRAVLLRCAGFNNVDIVTAGKLGLFVARVPAYSPEAVAEHALALIMTLNRQRPLPLR